MMEMESNHRVADEKGLPALSALGMDLTQISSRQRTWALTVPFLCVLGYGWLASHGSWPLAVLSLMYLSFITYGSTSHDLVHRNLGLSRRANDILLCLIELLALRSGHAYRLAHLHHHARYPAEDDVEGRASKLTLAGALVDGLTLQPRIWLWAMRRVNHGRAWVIGEGLACLLLASAAVILSARTLVPLIYAALMIMGSWIIPLITAYIPHDPSGKTRLRQTRLFRGRIASIVAMEHLYHLEHHLYPAVPHQNWPRLAKRLDTYFAEAGIRPTVLWF